MKPDEFELAVREHFAGELRRRFNVSQNNAHRGRQTGYRHNVDVSLERTVDGSGSLTLVECKFHARPVPSDLVMAFAFRIQDIGADKGLFISCSGYQLGSYRIASAVGMQLLLCVQRSPDYQLSAMKGNLPLQIFMAGHARQGEIQYARMVSDVQCCPIDDLNEFLLEELGDGK